MCDFSKIILRFSSSLSDPVHLDGSYCLSRRCDRFELSNHCQPAKSAETCLCRYYSRIETEGGLHCELPGHVMNEILYSTGLSPVITAS